jgi:hypothetical protein
MGAPILGAVFTTTCRTCAAGIVMIASLRGWRPCEPEWVVGYPAPCVLRAVVTDDDEVVGVLVDEEPPRPIGGRPLHRCAEPA